MRLWWRNEHFRYDVTPTNFVYADRSDLYDIEIQLNAMHDQLWSCIACIMGVSGNLLRRLIEERGGMVGFT